VGEDDPAGIGIGHAISIPAIDQVFARLFARLGGVDMASVLIGRQRFVGAAGGKLARGIALPVLGLAADGGDLDRAVTLGNTAERGAGFDGLELLGIADQHDLGAALFGFADHALHLARADHPGLVDDEDRFVGQQFATLAPLMLQTGDRARGNARAAFEVFGGNAGERRAMDGVAGRLPCFARHAQHRALAGAGIADDC
jgi:hypothetical protein